MVMRLGIIATMSHLTDVRNNPPNHNPLTGRRRRGLATERSSPGCGGSGRRRRTKGVGEAAILSDPRLLQITCVPHLWWLTNPPTPDFVRYSPPLHGGRSTTGKVANLIEELRCHLPGLRPRLPRSAGETYSLRQRTAGWPSSAYDPQIPPAGSVIDRLPLVTYVLF